MLKALGNQTNKKKEKTLSDFENYIKVSIDQPFRNFSEQILKNEEAQADYGILELLQGDWYSYIESDAQRVSNLKKNRFQNNIASGIHTTIMPSPGMDHNKIPGKFTFVSEEYIEKLSFNLVEGGVRNRGGATEQFCGAVKYEQSIKSVASLADKTLKYANIHEENGMYLWLSNLYGHLASKESIEEDRGVHRWDNTSGMNELVANLYPSTPNKKELANFTQLVHEHPYLDVEFFNVGTLDEPHYVVEKNLKGRNFVSFMAAKELRPGEGLNVPKFIPDYSISRSGVIPHGSTMTLLGGVNAGQKGIVNTGKPSFVKIDANILNILKTLGISEQLLLDIYNETKKNKIKKILEQGSDEQQMSLSLALNVKKTLKSKNLIEKLLKALQLIVANAYWDFKHLAFSKTMGGGISPSNDSRPFDFNYPPLPFTKMEDFNADNDNGEEEVYVQPLFTHVLYPYSVRPDLRLNDAIKQQNITKYIQMSLSSKKDNGAQGGVLNVPFVNRFVPTTEVIFNLWIEELEENGRLITQLQYEQIVFFEFGFGDGGGKTSWPHIQVNTLRKFEDLNEYSQKMAQKFIAV